jgi:hypothetical protein
MLRNRLFPFPVFSVTVVQEEDILRDTLNIGVVFDAIVIFETVVEGGPAIYGN